MRQINLFDAPTQIRESGLHADYCEQFLTNEIAHAAYHQIMETTEWTQPTLKVYGKWHLSPRLLQFFGDPHLRKSYSGQAHVPAPWTPLLLDLKYQVEAQSDAEFNCVLVNYYRDGQDSVGWHADDETQLGDNPVIASLTLGGQRPFDLRHQNDKQLKSIRIILSHGSLLVMRPPTQQYWHHQVPKTTRYNEPRLNLTFRRIVR
ncbi:MAG: alkylated DNA repair dioxygenase AlkB [Saprospiraceae bacterium]